MADISNNSRRVAKNTLLLYLRMLLMMFISLFTSRVILKALGVEDFGTYTAVYEAVMLFTMISNSISNAISRFMSFEIGKGDMDRQQRVFSSAIIIQTIMAVILTTLTLTLGIWYLRNGLNIPAGREGAAMWVLICSAGLMMVQLYSIPFNATIIACEDMSAFAYISILEAALKLAVAFLIIYSPIDRLVAYAVLMLAVGLIIRGTYAWYCRRNCPQTKGALCYDHALIKEMLGFSGWTILGSGMNVLSTKGISVLANSFFGVGINAARGVAAQVENIVKQFVSNFLTALNPQITKSWANGNKEYCLSIVGKGCKFSLFIMLFFSIPLYLEADYLLGLWLGDVPAHAKDFVQLTMLYLIMDMGFNSLTQLILSSGRLSAYYIAYSAILACGFAASWIAFATGCDPSSSYIAITIALLLCNVIKLIAAKRICGLEIASFLKEHIYGVFSAAAVAICLCEVIVLNMEAGFARMILTVVASSAAITVTAWRFAFTKGEKEFILEKIHKVTDR